VNQTYDDSDCSMSVDHDDSNNAKKQEVDKFYQLCNRYKPKVQLVIKKDANDNRLLEYETETITEPVFPVTEEDIQFAKSWLDDPNCNVNNVTVRGSYFHIAVNQKHFELAQLIISHNNRYDFSLLKTDNSIMLWLLCVYDQLDLLKTIMSDSRFDGDMLNNKHDWCGGGTILHRICSNDKLACDGELIKLVVNNSKFTCLNYVNEDNQTALMKLCYQIHTVVNLDTIKIITEHKNFDVNTLVLGTRDQGCTPVTISLSKDDVFVYMLKLVDKYELLSNFNTKRSLFAKEAYGLSIFDSVATHDDYYNSCCEIIKFVELHDMRDIIWDNLLKVKICYTGMKVFKLLKAYKTKPDFTIDSLINNTYDHNYEPNYFRDFPKEAITKVTDWYLYGKR